MPIDPEIARRVDEALSAGCFAERGGIITDLDGTAVHQEGDRVLIARRVQDGLERVRAMGRPVAVNSLRFPLSIMRTFGEQWAAWTSEPLPCVTLNGSLVGDIVRGAGGDLAFEERLAFPLAARDLEALLSDVGHALEAGADQLTLFLYPRDWRKGEIIWTASPLRIAQLEAKYVSASAVMASSIEELGERLEGMSVCMVTLLAENPHDPRLAFQHAHRSSYVTRPGIDKLSGAKRLAELLAFDLAASIGAGDTPLDTFLDGIGLALIVGNLDLDFKGLHGTVRLADPFAYGDVLFHVADRCGPASP